MKAPHIPEAEYVELAVWLKLLAETPSPTNRTLFRSAYEYASKNTGLSVDVVEKVSAFMDESTPQGTAARWVEYYLNEVRKHGQPPTLPPDL